MRKYYIRGFFSMLTLQGKKNYRNNSRETYLKITKVKKGQKKITKVKKGKSLT